MCHFIGFALSGGVSSEGKKTATLGEPNRTSCSGASISPFNSRTALANILYTSAGTKSYPKETVTVFCNSKVGTLDNFTKAKIFSGKGKKIMRKANQEKGFLEEYNLLKKIMLSESKEKVDFTEVFMVTESTIRISNLQNKTNSLKQDTGGFM